MFSKPALLVCLLSFLQCKVDGRNNIFRGSMFVRERDNLTFNCEINHMPNNGGKLSIRDFIEMVPKDLYIESPIIGGNKTFTTDVFLGADKTVTINTVVVSPDKAVLNLNMAPFTCDNTGVYICTSDNDSQSSSSETHVKLFVNEVLTFKNEQYIRGGNEHVIQNVSYIQGSTNVVMCTVQSTPHTFSWIWTFSCPQAKAVNDMTFLQSEDKHRFFRNDNGYYCLLENKNSSVTFTATQDVDGCQITCSLLPEENNRKSSFFEVKIKVVKTPTRTFRDVCYYNSTSGFVLAIGVVVTIICVWVAYVSYQVEGAFNREKWQFMPKEVVRSNEDEDSDDLEATLHVALEKELTEIERSNIKRQSLTSRQNYK